MCVAEAGDGTLVVSDYGNNRVKAVLTSGVVTNLYGVTSKFWGGTYPGWYDGAVKIPDSTIPNAQSRQPFGVVVASDGSFYTSEDYYHIIRKVTGANLPSPPPPPPVAPTIWSVTTNYGQVTLSWYAVDTATNYYVKRSTSSGPPYTIIAQTDSTSYTDNTVINGRTYYYVVSAVNTGGESTNSVEVRATPPLPPVPDPQIGYVDFPASASPEYTSVFHPESSYDFYNDATIIIKGTPGSETYYITTNDAALASNPTINSASVPSDYQDGLLPGQVLSYQISQVSPVLTVKAVGAKSDGSPNSAVVQSTFRFITGNPSINGNNASQFTISDITANAHLYYTIDGSDPSQTNGIDLGTVASPTNSWTLGFQITTNTLFKVRAFRANYQPSAIVSNSFSPSNFLANIISFGFASGEASSDFVGAPGQTFYAPVTLSVLPNTTMYSLQFNVTVTNLGSDTITPGAYDFQSMLMKPIPNTTPPLYTPIPPWMYNGTGFTDLEVTNTSLNLLGVGWVERAGFTNLYDTTKQDLLQFSQAHDDTFFQSGGQVIVGGYGFQIPTSATNGEQYQIQIGRPSATSDGIGTPGSSVYIATPTNGSLASGTINSIKNVTVGQRKYIAGNAYPFRWFNAGDFGNTNMQNADVVQVFESAVYSLNTPPTNTDFYDCMDSSGCYGVYDSTHGYYTNAGPLSLSDKMALFNTTDPVAFAQALNTNMFGDTNLDVSDVFVTYVRSIDSDPSINWIQRFWTNGVRGALPIANVFNPNLVTKNSSVTSKPKPAITSVSITNQPEVNFTAGDIQGSAGQVVQIPIYANIFGDYPLRLLMLNLTVVPLDGSPSLATQVQFAANPTLGQPYFASPYSTGNGNYANVWLNNTNAGLVGNALIGTLTVTIPANATTSSAYAVHFDHASASPNGLASFPKQTLTGLVTLSSRTNSSYGDGIPGFMAPALVRHHQQSSLRPMPCRRRRRQQLAEICRRRRPNDASHDFKNIEHG